MTACEQYPDGPPDLQSLAARRNDPRARAQFVQEVHQMVRRYCRALIGRTGRTFDAADTLAGEVAGGVLRERREDLAGTLPVEAIIYDRMAKAVAETLADRPARTARPARGPVSPEQLHEHLGLLPPRSREVLVLRAFVGLSSEQVGRALGVPHEVVQQEQQVALTHLRSR